VKKSECKLDTRLLKKYWNIFVLFCYITYPKDCLHFSCICYVTSPVSGEMVDIERNKERNFTAFSGHRVLTIFISRLLVEMTSCTEEGG
jgi:hypothetical protein